MPQGQRITVAPPLAATLLLLAHQPAPCPGSIGVVDLPVEILVTLLPS